MKPQALSPSRAFLLVALALALLAAPAWAGVGVWTPVGPGVSWIHSIRSLVVPPSIPGSLWIGMPMGGLYRSSDQGETWSWAGRPMAGWGVVAVTADPNQTWAATGDGVFLTQDGGSSWTRSTGESYISALAGEGPRTIAVSAGTLFVLTRHRLLVSPDHGMTWSLGYEADADHAITALGSEPSGTEGLYIAATSSQGFDLLKSPNGLPPWTSVRPWTEVSGIDQILVTRTAVYAMPTDAGSALLRSRDRGATWRSVLTGDPSLAFSAVAADPRWPHAVWVTGWSAGHYALWVSRDDGTTWQAHPTLPLLGTFLATDPEAHALYVSDGDSLVRSRDGGATWNVVLTAPEDDSPPAQLAFSPDDPSRMAMAVGDHAFLSGDGGRTWRSLPASAGPMTSLAFVPGNPNRMLGVAGGYKVMATADGGRTWERTALPGSGPYLESLVRADSRTFYVTGCGIYRSTDQGRTWGTALACSSRYADVSRFAQKLEIDPVHPSRLYALTFQPKEFFHNHGILAGAPSFLWKSADRGLTWQKIAADFRAFAFDRIRSRLYAARDKDLLASDDAGAHWRKVAETPVPVNELLVDRTDPLTLYAASGKGVLRSRDGGQTWVRFDQSRVSDNYWYSYVYSLVQHPTNPATLYATADGGILQLTFPDGP